MGGQHLHRGHLHRPARGLSRWKGKFSKNLSIGLIRGFTNVLISGTPRICVHERRSVCFITVQMHIMFVTVRCKSGWTPFYRTGRCYKMVSSGKDWNGARAHCQGQGPSGDLASIPDQETNEFITSLLPDAGGYWIGGTDAASEGAWQWSDGTPWGYTNWGSGEPNNDGGQHYLVTANGLWADAALGSWGRWFICQDY